MGGLTGRSYAVALREAYTATVSVKVVLLVPELSAVTVTDSGYSRLLGVKVSVAPALTIRPGLMWVLLMAGLARSEAVVSVLTACTSARNIHKMFQGA